MAEILGHPAGEGIWSRAKSDSCELLKKHWFAVWDAFVAGLGGSAVGALIPDWWGTPVLYSHGWAWTIGWQVVAASFATALIFTLPILAVLNWNLIRAPFRQRNEARSIVIPTDDDLELAVSHSSNVWLAPSIFSDRLHCSTGEILLTSRSGEPMTLDVSAMFPMPPDAKFHGDVIWVNPLTERLPFENETDDLEGLLGRYVTLDSKKSAHGRFRFWLSEYVVIRAKEMDADLNGFIHKSENEPQIQFIDQVSGKRLIIGMSQSHQPTNSLY